MSSKTKKATAKVSGRVAAKKSTAKAASAKPAVVKKTSAAKNSEPTPKLSSLHTIAPLELSHRIHALLHTIHQIERYEERLCSMQDAIKRSGRLNASLLRDLSDLLEEIPSVEYQHDLEAVRDAVLG